MRVIRTISPDEMVLEFLRGEIDSPRFGPTFVAILSRSNLSRALIDHANPQDARENRIRSQLLGAVRGYGQGQYLFTGIPQDLKWQRVALDRVEFAGLLYANHETWTTLSGGTRKLSEGAANVNRIPTAEDANSNIRAVAAEVAKGKDYPPIILFGDGNGKLVIAEGHTRATAYLFEGSRLPDEREVILGTSTSIGSWIYW